MIEMIRELFKEVQGDIITLIDRIKEIGTIGKTIIEINNTPGMEAINNLKLTISIIAIIAGVLIKYIKNKIRRR